MIQIFLVLIFCHLVCDFIFQSKKIVSIRVSSNIKKSFKGNFIHSLTHFIFSLVMVIIFYKIKYIFLDENSLYTICFLIALIHFSIDVGKSVILNKYICCKNSIQIFLIDQGLHFISILFLCIYFTDIDLVESSHLLLLDKIFIALIMFTMGTFVAGIFLKMFIEYFFPKNFYIDDFNIFKESRGAKDGGHIIGILERIFIMISITIGHPEMAGFVLTAKSIARFKKLDDANFAEIFIIGTFISFIIAIICGVVIFKLNIFPTI